MFSAATSGLQLAQVLDPLLDRDADRAGRVVDDHVVDLGEDRLGDRAEVLDLVGRHAVRRARVDVDLRAALVDDPPRLGRVLLRRVGDRRALVAVGDRARDRAADDHRVLEAAHVGLLLPHARLDRPSVAASRKLLRAGELAVREPEHHRHRLDRARGHCPRPLARRRADDQTDLLADLAELVSARSTKLSQGSSRSRRTAVPSGHGPTLPRLRRSVTTAGTTRSRGATLAIEPISSRRASTPGLEALAGEPRRCAVAHTGITPCFFHGRSTRLSVAIRRPLITSAGSRAGR